MEKESNKKEKPKQSGDAKGKASFDQNGEGNSPKYAHSGEDPNENGALQDQAFNIDKSKKRNKK